MLHPTVQIALLGVGSGLLTLVIGEVFRRWRSGSDMIRDQNVEADSDHKTMEALTAAFRAIADRQANDIGDLQERLRRVEDALLVAQERNVALSKENTKLARDNDRLRHERDECRARADQAEGQVRQLQQLALSHSRVYGQGENDLDDDEEPRLDQPDA